LRAYHRLGGLWPRAWVGQVLLDHLPHASWLLGDRATILAANEAARHAQCSATRVSAEGPALLLRDPAAQRRFDGAMAVAVVSHHGRRLLVPLTAGAGGADGSAGQPRLVLQRLDSPACRDALAMPRVEPLLLATLYDPDLAAPLDAQALAGMFGLTPAESRVAVCLAQGRTGAAIATVLGVAPSTVRSQLDQVMAKLGVSRKLDAVRLLSQAGWMLRASRTGEAG
jgi:DNA-binding CsgD family transcriptional regulator